MHKKRLLIFDLDGTLIDSLTDLTNAVNHMRDFFGLESLSNLQVRALIGKGARNLVERALPGFEEESITKGLKIFLNYNNAHLLDNTILYPGVKETLQVFSEQGKMLAVISNKNTDLCRSILSSYSISNLFVDIFGADAVDECKPSPKPLLKIMQEHAVPASDAVMIGDSLNDISAGLAAGINTVGCTYGYGSPEELIYADWKVDEFRELLRLPI